MIDPKNDEDTVNLGYLKRVIKDGDIEFPEDIVKTYSVQPVPPYYAGDTWINGNMVYTCIKTRLVGAFNENDWTTESGAKEEAERKNKTYLVQPSNYRAGDMWILQSDTDHRAGKKGEILISTASRAIYDADDWVNMLGYGSISSINEMAEKINNAINTIGVESEAIQDEKIIIFYQNTVPAIPDTGDLWYLTGELTGYVEGALYQYNGTSWQRINDDEIVKVFEEANEARITSDGKIQSFYCSSEPTQNVGDGDIWTDISNDDKLYRYNGTNWIPVYDTYTGKLVTDVEVVSQRISKIETDIGEIILDVREDIQTLEDTQVAQKQELESKINIKAGEIISTVNNTLTDYSTTSQMNSAINQKASEINAVVAQKIDDTDITKAYLILKITNNQSSTKIGSDIIDISASDILNLFASNQMNLKSENISLVAGNLNITNDLSGIYEYSEYDLAIVIAKVYGMLTGNNILNDMLDVNEDGRVNTTDALYISRIINHLRENTKSVTGKVVIDSKNPKNAILIKKGNDIAVSIGVGGINTHILNAQNILCGNPSNSNDFTGLTVDGATGIMTINKNSEEKFTVDPNKAIGSGLIEVNGTDLFKQIYPVGSIYMSVNNTNPSNYFGGTWVAWGSGRVPVGVNTNDTSFSTVEKTGGAKTHTLTVNEMPSHSHRIVYTNNGKELSLDDGGSNYNLSWGSSGCGNGNVIANSTGGGQAHNNLPPYITCYMWKRTA